jgi:BlaI family transcriptional regulator, penicillinase repressor
MKANLRISEAEWEVMKVIWCQGPASANTVIAALSKRDGSWHPKTVKTYLARLVGKRAIEFHKEGRAYVYKALVTEQECVDAASTSFLGRVFGGSLKPMLAHFVEHRKLSPAEIRELKQLLEDEGKRNK